jgi:hypothetical protein
MCQLADGASENFSHTMSVEVVDESCYVTIVRQQPLNDLRRRKVGHGYILNDSQIASD